MFVPYFSILILTKKKNKNKLDIKIEALIVGWVNKENKRKEKNKLSSLTLSLLNPSSPIHSQQEQLYRSQDPNSITT